MKKVFLKTAPVLLSLLVSEAAFSQAVQSMRLNLDKMKSSTLQGGDPVQSLDLMTEAKRQNPALRNLPTFDLNQVDVSLKTGMGGASAYLLINNEHVDSQSVETDPDRINEPGGEASVQLKNIERRVDQALLTVIGQAVVRSVTIFFGAISDVAVLGSYATADATQVGNATPTAEEPIVLVRPPVDLVRPNGQGTAPVLLDPNQQSPVLPPVTVKPTPSAPIAPPVVITPPPQPEPPRPVEPVQPRPQLGWHDVNCVANICVGDIVTNNFGFEGKVLRAYPQRGLLEIQFSFSKKPTLREPSQVKFKRRG
jgi:hypothetical protein